MFSGILLAVVILFPIKEEIFMAIGARVSEYYRRGVTEKPQKVDLTTFCGFGVFPILYGNVIRFSITKVTLK